MFHAYLFSSVIFHRKWVTGESCQRITSGVICYLTPPAMQAALKQPQLFLSDVAGGGVHGDVRWEPGLGEGLVNRYSLLLCCGGSCCGYRART